MMSSKLQPETINRYCNHVRQFMKWCSLEKVSTNKVLTCETILFYMNDVYQAGFGVGKATHLLFGLDWLSGVVGQYTVWSEHPYLKKAKARWARGDKKSKKTRHYLSRSEMLYLLQQPPPDGEVIRAWRMFFCISWVFLLRRSEVVKMLPGDVTKRSRGGKLCYEVYVRNPKTAKGQVQTVYIPVDTVPIPMREYLDWWASSGTCPDEWDPWDVLVTQKKVIPWLRSIFPKVKPASLCHHSCRHGRATDLFHNCSYAIGGDSHGNKCLTTVGRWRSKAACMCYLHSKINWKD